MPNFEKNTLVRAFNKAPGEAVDFLNKKVSRASWNWYDSLEGSYEGAFTVAKTASADVVETIRLALLDAQKKGLPFEVFQKNIEPTLQSLGWWGKDDFLDANLGSPWRLETIYRTNLQSAFNAGRMERQQKTEKFRPLLEYVAVLDSKTRPSHSALDGKVVQASDSFWNSFYPPNGFNCRCRVRSLSISEAKRDGKDVSNFDGKIDSKEVYINKSLDIKTTVAVVKVGNRTVSPDAGFSKRPALMPPRPKTSSGKYKVTGKDLSGYLVKAPLIAKQKAAAVIPPKLLKAPKVAPKNIEEMISRSFEEVSKNLKDIAPLKPFEFKATDNSDTLSFEFEGKERIIFKSAQKRIEAVFSKNTFLDQVKEFHEQLVFNEGGKINKDLIIVKNEIDVVATKLVESRFKNEILKKIKETIKDFDSLSLEKQTFEQGKFLGLHSIEQTLPDEISLFKKMPAAPKNGRRASFSNVNVLAQEIKLTKTLKDSDEFNRRNISIDLINDADAIRKLNINTETMKGAAGAYYRDSTKDIRFPGTAKASDLSHEFTHFVHFQNKEIQKVVNEYFAKRVEGNRIYKHWLYGYTADDKFTDEYFGKAYQQIIGGKERLKNNFATKNPLDYTNNAVGGVEFLTRSVDRFIDRPLDLFVSDPEAFAFSRAVLLGDLPK